jgi:sulfite reductase alpha subunit-like flavoprotein
MEPVRILYATESGNSERCAGDLEKALQNQGYSALVTNMEYVEGPELANAQLVVIITSTFGNGDPPHSAGALLDWLTGRPRLAGLPFAVCALGDRSYPRFAQCGKDFDRALARAGGLRLFDRVECESEVRPDYRRFRSQFLYWMALHGEGFRTGPAAEHTWWRRLTSWGREAGPVWHGAARPRVGAKGLTVQLQRVARVGERVGVRWEGGQHVGRVDAVQGHDAHIRGVSCPQGEAVQVSTAPDPVTLRHATAAIWVGHEEHTPMFDAWARTARHPVWILSADPAAAKLGIDTVRVHHSGGLGPHAGEVYQALSEGAHLVSCGPAATALPAVRESLVAAATSQLGERRGPLWVSHLEESHRYLVDPL